MPSIGSAQTECFPSLAIPRVKGRGGEEETLPPITASLLHHPLRVSVETEHLRTAPSLRQGDEEVGKGNMSGHFILAWSSCWCLGRGCCSKCRLQAQGGRTEAPLGKAIPWGRVGKSKAEEDAFGFPGSGSSAEEQGLAQVQRGLEGDWGMERG